MAICDYCGKDISIVAKRCPNCGETSKTLTLEERQTEWSDNFAKNLLINCFLAGVIWLVGFIFLAVSDLPSGLAEAWGEYGLLLVPFFVYYSMRKPKE